MQVVRRERVVRRSAHLGEARAEAGGAAVRERREREPVAPRLRVVRVRALHALVEHVPDARREGVEVRGEVGVLDRAAALALETGARASPKICGKFGRRVENVDGCRSSMTLSGSPRRAKPGR